MTSVSVELKPQFLGEAGGRHFSLQFKAVGAARGHIVFLPPFAEEMNRCRALVALQARALCAVGYHCTVLDFYGTGDSEGELANASLSIWHDNIDTALEAIKSASSLPVSLWGLRTGALIAADYATRSQHTIQNLLLWQPVTSGKRFVVQLLRQRVAALVNSGLPAETTSQIRQRLSDGESVEVSGYILGGSIIEDIESLQLADTAPRFTGSAFWLENVDVDGEPLPTGSQKVVDKLVAKIPTLEVHTCTGAPVWQLHKRDAAPRLVALTTELLSHC